MECSSKTKVPVTQMAIVQDLVGKPIIADGIPVPTLRPGTMLVKTIAVSLNPSDNKMGQAFPTPGAIIGMDFAGEVVKIMNARGGDDSTLDRLHVGDKVCGTVHGSNPADPTNGSFGEYVRATPGLVLQVPEGFPLEQATALGTPLLTSCIALWGSLGIEVFPLEPTTKVRPVLVYGGSTAVGTMAIQLLKILGYDPVSTSSPHNFDMVKSYGASAVFDYASSNVALDIKAHTGGRLRHALDCIADRASTACCYASLGRPGGHYSCLEAIPQEWKSREAVKAEFIMALEAFGEVVMLDGEYGRPLSVERHNLSLRLFETFQKLLSDGMIKAHPTEVIGRGFESVLQGLNLLKSGSVSGKKLVVWIQ